MVGFPFRLPILTLILMAACSEECCARRQGKEFSVAVLAQPNTGQSRNAVVETSGAQDEGHHQ